MDSIRVSEAPDPGSIPGEATIKSSKSLFQSGFGVFENFLVVPWVVP
jgi:hypothetical protein